MYVEITQLCCELNVVVTDQSPYVNIVLIYVCQMRFIEVSMVLNLESHVTL